MNKRQTNHQVEAVITCIGPIAALGGFSLVFFTILLAAMLSCHTSTTAAAATAQMMSTLFAAAWFTFRLAEIYDNCSRSSRPIEILLLLGMLSFILALRVPVVGFISAVVASQGSRDPAWFWSAGVVVSIVVPRLIVEWLTPVSYATEFLRGTRIISMESARRRANAKRKRGNAVFDWCGIKLADYLAVGHFLLVGAPGSGKTVSMRLLMASILPYVRRGRDWRALVYDAKQDTLEILSGMRLRCPVVVLNALDARSAAWDMAADIDSPAVALQVASNLIPEEKTQNVFFVHAARDLLAAVFIALHLTRPGNWTLADAVLTLSNSDKTKRLLQLLPETRHIADEYFSRDERTLADIQKTISAHTAMLRPIAAAWSKSTHRISLHQWIDGEFILVLGNDETVRGPIDAMNRVIVERISQLVLAQSESRRRRTWFFFDELKEAGRLDSLARLLTKGRSKGVRAVLGFQTIEGMRSVYGNELADDLAGLCANKALLRTDSPVTAKWAAEIIGEMERREWRQSNQSGPGGVSRSMSDQIVKREAMLASQLMRLPLATPKRFAGYFVTPGIGVYCGVVEFAGRLRPMGRVANFVARPSADQYIVDNSEPSVSGDATDLDDLGTPWDDENDFQ